MILAWTQLQLCFCGVGVCAKSRITIDFVSEISLARLLKKFFISNKFGEPFPSFLYLKVEGQV